MTEVEEVEERVRYRREGGGGEGREESERLRIGDIGQT